MGRCAADARLHAADAEVHHAGVTLGSSKGEGRRGRLRGAGFAPFVLACMLPRQFHYSVYAHFACSPQNSSRAHFLRVHSLRERSHPPTLGERQDRLLLPTVRNGHSAVTRDSIVCCASIIPRLVSRLGGKRPKTRCTFSQQPLRVESANLTGAPSIWWRLLVMVCTDIGASPPTGTDPTIT